MGGFGNNLAAVTWQPIWHRQQLPSDRGNDHDVMVSITDRGLVGADLDYALYGWWAITPYDGDLGHPYYFTLNAVGGIGVGLPTEVAALPASGTWKGRITGHVGEQPARNRYTVDGDLTLSAATRGGSVELDGVIDNTHIIAVDRDTLRVVEGATAAAWHELQLQGAVLNHNAFEGTATVSGTAGAGPDFTNSNGFFFGRFYGPAAEELAGEWGLRAEDRLGAAAGGFGARRQP